MEERLQKVLAAAGVASRREAEKYILGGRVKVNGKVVKELGTKVDEKCFITVDGKPIKRERKAYYLFYKPRGVVTTMSDPQGRRTVADYVKDLPQRVFPVGRLDYNTEGLLLLTNDGALAQADAPKPRGKQNLPRGRAGHCAAGKARFTAPWR